MNEYAKIIEKLQKDSAKKESKPMSKSTGPSLSYLDMSKEGMYRFRVFPDRRGEQELPFYKVARHWWTNPSTGKPAPYKCSGKGCPMCAFYNKKVLEGAEDAWKYNLKNVFMYYGLNDQEQVSLITTNYFVNEELKKKMVAQFKSGIDIMSLNEGRWITLTIKKVNGVFKQQISIEEEHKATLAQREHYVSLKPLDQFYKDFTDEELKQIMRGEKVDFSEKKSAPSTASSSSSIAPAKGEKEKELDLKAKMTAAFPELEDPDFVDDIELDESMLQSDEELERMASKDVSKGKNKLASIYDEDED